MSDVVIVGGGVIGLSIAYLLAGEGRSVTLLDRGPLGREASWAGAGIISPGAERPSRLPMSQLRTLSARMHAEWAEALREETGIDNGYRRSGGVDVALDDRDAHDLSAASGRWRDEGIAFERMEPSEFPRVEPTLGPAVRLAYFLPDRAQIRNPRHLRALVRADTSRGVEFLTGREVVGVVVNGDRVQAVRTQGGSIACETMVVAAGAWSGRLLETMGARISTRPIRGQIALIGPSEGEDRPRRIVECGKNYLVPRDDGRVLIGSTEEDAGFDHSTTPEAIVRLVSLARTLCPCLEKAPIERSWAGLRPGSLDTKPYLGRVPGLCNAFVATGHQRAGLQLSTGTARVVVDLIAGRGPAIDLEAFRLDRRADSSEDSFRS